MANRKNKTEANDIATEAKTQDDIIILDTVTHVLMSLNNHLVLSEKMTRNDSNLNDFLRKHISRVLLSDDAQMCRFDNDSKVKETVAGFNRENLLEISHSVSKRLFNIMKANIDIPEGDLVFVLFRESGRTHLAILKMNYKAAYAHHENAEEVAVDIKTAYTLPQTTPECCIIFDDMKVKLMEKKYDINGVKTEYFSSMFLGCSKNIAAKKKLDIVTKAIEKVQEKYMEDDCYNQMLVKKVLKEELIESGYIDISEISEKVFEGKEAMQAELDEELDKHNIRGEHIAFINEKSSSKIQKHVITLDSGIEISVPVDICDDESRIKINTNGDGSLNIIINNGFIK